MLGGQAEKRARTMKIKVKQRVRDGLSLRRPLGLAFTGLLSTLLVFVHGITSSRLAGWLAGPKTCLSCFLCPLPTSNSPFNSVLFCVSEAKLSLVDKGMQPTA